MAIVIEKGIPIPRARNRSDLTIAVRTMGVGDSFVVDSTQRPGVQYAAKATGFKLATRRLPDGNIRVWRLS